MYFRNFKRKPWRCKHTLFYSFYNYEKQNTRIAFTNQFVYSGSGSLVQRAASKFASGP